MRPKKSLGQNFCVDPRVVAEVVARLEPGPDDEVWELGPGPGALTDLLVGCGARRVRAFEIDERLRPELEVRFADHLWRRSCEGDACAAPTREQALHPAGSVVGAIHESPLRSPPAGGNVVGGEGRLSLHWGDFLQIDLRPWLPVAGGFLACGNLPYSCATPMIRRLLDLSPRPPDRMVFVVQEEVARKAVATPGMPAYGFLSAQLQMRAELRMGSVFPPASFRPVPKVSSAILEVRPLALPPAELLRRQRALWLLSAMMRQRRKMAINLVRRAIPLDWGALFDQIGLPRGCRGEVIPFAALLAMVDAIHEGVWPTALRA